MGAAEIESFLSHLAVESQVSASTQNQALQAILFLYQRVPEIDLPRLDQVTRARRPKRLPVVLTVADIRTVQELLGHTDVRATMLYTHVLGKGAMGVKSPLDRPRTDI